MRHNVGHWRSWDICSYVRPVMLPESTKNINCVKNEASALDA
jgi:hypothetical protein